MKHYKHELNIFIDKKSKVLILGSFPSVKSREKQFYYSHPSNRFFPVLYKIFSEECSSSIEDRKDFLYRHHITLYDVIEECDIEGSSDSSIRNPTPFDIISTLDKYPNITTIGITGKKASSLFDKYLKDKVPNNIRVIHLPSTSPANAKMRLLDLVEEYKKLFEL